MAIDNDEGAMLAKASANVLAQFDITPDPKTQAIIGLVMAAGAVYAPRAIAIRMRLAAEREAAKNGTGSAPMYNAEGAFVGSTSFSAVNEPGPGSASAN